MYDSSLCIYNIANYSSHSSCSEGITIPLRPVIIRYMYGNTIWKTWIASQGHKTGCKAYTKRIMPMRK